MKKNEIIKRGKMGIENLGLLEHSERKKICLYLIAYSISPDSHKVANISVYPLLVNLNFAYLLLLYHFLYMVILFLLYLLL